MRNSFFTTLCLFIFGPLFTTNSFAQTSVKQYGTCGGKATVLEIETFEMDSRFFFPKTNGPKVILRPKTSGCFEAGKHYKAMSKEYWHEWGTVTVEKIETVKFENQAALAKALNLAPEFIKVWFPAAYGVESTKDDVALLTLSPMKYVEVKNKYFPGFALVPHIHPFHVEPIKASQAVSVAQKANMKIIDLRSPEEFNKNHIKGAINIPYHISAEVKKDPAKAYAAPLNWLNSLNGDSFDWSKLPEKNVGFIFYGTSLWDLRAKRFNEHRFVKGYRNLKWIHGGISEYNAELASVPKVIAGLKVVSTDDIKGLERKGAQFVDVRTPEQFAGIHFVKSVNVPYHSTAFRMAELSGSLDKTVARLNVAGEKFETSKLQKSKPVIIYAWSEYQDEAWKAALMAKKAGHDVYLWRDGLGQWWARCNLDPKNYTCESQKASLW